MRSHARLGAVGLAVLVIGSCSDNDIGPEVSNFTATLNGAGAATTSTATGTATFSVVPGGMLYRIDISTAIDSVTAAHIHAPAPIGMSAGVVVPLFGGPTTGPGFTGTLVAGVAPTPIGMKFDSVLVLMRNGNAYVNVHTRAHPGGEIRGQIAVQ